MRVTKAYLSKSEEVCSKTLNQCVSEVQELRSLLLPEWPEKVFEEGDQSPEKGRETNDANRSRGNT